MSVPQALRSCFRSVPAGGAVPAAPRPAVRRALLPKGRALFRARMSSPSRMAATAALLLTTSLAAPSAWAQAAPQPGGVRIDPTPPGAPPLVTGGASAQAPAPTPAPTPDKSGYWFFNPPPDSALRGFNTDRPTKSNSPVTVDAGHLQYETDIFNYTHSNVGGVSTRIYTAFDPVIKAGITNWADLELQFTGYNWLTVRDPRSGARIQDARGVGDLLLRAKINLFGNEGGPAAALIPYVKFPTASRYIGNGHTEGGVIAPISFPIPFGFTLLIVPEVDVLKNAADAGHHFNFTQLINISRPITPKLTAYAEFYSMLGTDSRNPPVYTFDTALSYAVTDTLQLDVGTNIGLNRNAPNLQAYTGISQRF